MYHTCDEYGNKFTYHCPEETAFRQDALICDHAHLVNCEGFSTKDNKKYNDSSHIREPVDNIQSQFLHQRLQLAQPIKTSNNVQHGLAFSSRHFLKTFNETEASKNKITKFLQPPLYEFNSTTPASVNYFANIKTSYTPFINQNQSGIRKNGTSFVQNQNSNNKDKFNEREETNQKDSLDQKTNDAFNHFWKYSSDTFSDSLQNQQENTKKNQTTKNSRDNPKLSFTNHRNYPYLETLKSIQKNTKAPSTSTTAASTISNTFLTTTEIPVYALTLSLKPLLPIELEYDPYYPKVSTSTESYYTPTHNSKAQSYTRDFTQTSRSNTHLKLPSILPDLNSLDDIVDRRKLFYIPRIKFD
ncbi:uncharacterized protein LOC143185963 isoform X2 [Calliopsis andreniformis]